MTIIEALENALMFLESAGYRGGDVHDDLAQAIRQLRTDHPKVAMADLPVRRDW